MRPCSMMRMRLVEHPRHAAVAQVAAQRAVRRVVEVRDDRVDADDEIGPALDREVDVRRLLDTAVDVVPPPDAHGAVEPGHGNGGLDRLRDRHCAPASAAEGDGLAAVEVHRDHVELAQEVAEAVASQAGDEDAVEVLLDPAGLHQARGQELEEGPGEVGEVAALAGEARDEGPGQDPRGLRRAPEELQRAEAVQGSRGDAEGRSGALGGLVVHLAGRHARREDRGHERAARDPHVQVEVEDAAAQELVEGSQAADLVHGSRDAAARADERHLGLPSSRGGSSWWVSTSLQAGVYATPGSRSPARAGVRRRSPGSAQALPGGAFLVSAGSRRPCARAPRRGG